MDVSTTIPAAYSTIFLWLWFLHSNKRDQIIVTFIYLVSFQKVRVNFMKKHDILDDEQDWRV